MRACTRTSRNKTALKRGLGFIYDVTNFVIFFPRLLHRATRSTVVTTEHSVADSRAWRCPFRRYRTGGIAIVAAVLNYQQCEDAYRRHPSRNIFMRNKGAF